MEELYDMIFKRKSFHIFNDPLQITSDERACIEKKISNLKPLIDSIQTKIKIVPASDACKRKEEYCLYFYSEKKPHYLQNIGYMGEQLDLYLASLNIGALWYGIGKPEEKEEDGLDFVIMMAISKMPQDKFRKDMYKSKRKPLDEIWEGSYAEIGNIVRFAPSACNTQPWLVKATDKEMKVFRYKKPGKRGIMPKDRVVYYNRIDMGIFLCILEICLAHHSFPYQRELLFDDEDEIEEIEYAKYILNDLKMNRHD